MRRHVPLLALMLLCVPAVACAIQLHWSNGADTLTFSEATRCTLTIQADETEGSLPPEWRLLWVAEGLPNLEIIPDSTFASPTMAQAISVVPPSAAELGANQITTNFRYPGSPAIAGARWILDLPVGSAGKFVAYALLPGQVGESATLSRSNVATFNGGVWREFPALAISATADHSTTRLAVTASGAGLASATAASLVAADTSWRVPLTIVEATDSTLSAEAEVPTQLPDAILQVTLADEASTVIALPTSQVVAPQLESVTTLGNSFLVPPDSLNVNPKDFAFVYNTVPTAIPGVWRGLFHLIYIRRLPNGSEWTLGHAWSPNLQDWTSDRYAFRTGPIGTWDAGHVWAPSVVQHGNVYHMFYTGVDAGGNQRIGRVTTTLLDTTNTVWSTSDRKLVFAADSTTWVVRHPSHYLGADQFRDPYVFSDPDSTGRFLMVYTAVDTNYKTIDGHSVGLARNRPGTLERWLDLGRYGFTDYGRNGHLSQVESPHVIPDSGYAPPYWITGARPTGWKLMYTWGGTHPAQQTLRFSKDAGIVNVADTASAGWGTTQTLYSYLAGDTTVVGWNGSEHLKAGNVDYIAGYNAYVVDGIQIARMYWSGADFFLKLPAVTGIDAVGSGTAAVALSILKFDPVATHVQFRISVPTALLARLEIYDVAGRRLRTLLDRRLPEGDTLVQWDRSSAEGVALPSGVYFAYLRYESGGRVARIPLVR